jgi:glycosyltransferase involved in cell wall biosynthesis
VSGWLPAAIVSCSARARDIHVAAGYDARKFVVVPNGFELDRFRPDPAARAGLRAELGLAADTPLVGHVGRWHPQKNHRGLLQAVAQVARQRPDVRFVLAGEDVENANPELGREIERLGLAARVHALGRRDDVPRLMAALDVFVSSSDGEAFPNVVGEAMACGVPCVVTDVGDCAELVDGGGWAVPAGDMAQLAARVGALLDAQAAERRRIGEIGRRRIEAHYEIGAVVRQYERVYDSVLAIA